IMYLAFIWAEKRNKPGAGRYLLFITYLAFIGVGIHMTIFLVMPIVFLLILLVDWEKLVDWRFWMAGGAMFLVTFALEPFLIAIAGVLVFSIIMISTAKKVDKTWRLILAMMIAVIVGYSVQGFIPVRSAQRPMINENSPDNWKAFKFFLERKQYGQESMITRMFNRRGAWESQFGAHKNMGFWGFFREQYSSDKLRFIPFVLGVLGIWEAVRRRWKMGSFLLLMFLACSVGLVLYMNFSDGTLGERLEVRERDYFFTPGFMFFAILMGIGVSGFIHWVLDIFGNKINERIRLAIAVVLGVLSIAFPLTDTRSFHLETHDRTNNYIPWDYAYNILQTCDQDGMIFTNGDNDTFPLWFLQEVAKVRNDVRVVNLSLLNTPWYIHQIKDQMDVPMRLTDSQIDKLTPVMTPDRKIIRVQDVMIQEIITANNWKVPVYFAVTVSQDNRMNLEENLRMEGMAYRIVPEKGKDLVDSEALENNLFNVYKFRGIADPEVYKNENAGRLIANYVSAFLQLSEYYKVQGNYEKAIEIAESALGIYSDGWRPYAFLVQIYSDLDDFEGVRKIVERAPEGEYERLYLNSGYAFTQAGKTEKAIKIYKDILEKFPESEPAFQLLLKLYYEQKNYQDIVDLIDIRLEQEILTPQIRFELQQLKTEIARLIKGNTTEVDTG
ncbi:MAG: tetratricopeptide repeat protein, partial [candidate division Zixibacteria bacterium]|nr:tetratricopeptide repeat protein [candidate division Zixibacteria bacterium]